MRGFSRDLVFEGTGLVNGSCEDAVADRLLDRQALASDGCLVDTRPSDCEHAVEGDAFSRLDAHGLADGHGLDRHIGPAAVRLLHRCPFRRELHQVADGISCPIQRLGFDPLGDGEQHHHHGRFRPLSQQYCAGDGNAHQGVDIEIAVTQGDPALLIGADTAEGDRDECQQRDQPFRPGEPVRDFRPHGGHAGQGHRPPGLADRRASYGSALHRFGRHAEVADGILYGEQGIVPMDHGQHALHQIEFQTVHSGHAAKLLAYQGFFGRAIHLGNAQTGQRVAGWNMGHDLAVGIRGRHLRRSA